MSIMKCALLLFASPAVASAEMKVTAPLAAAGTVGGFGMSAEGDLGIGKARWSEGKVVLSNVTVRGRNHSY